jgi:hypothetical protein
VTGSAHIVSSGKGVASIEAASRAAAIGDLGEDRSDVGELVACVAGEHLSRSLRSGPTSHVDRAVCHVLDEDGDALSLGVGTIDAPSDARERFLARALTLGRARVEDQEADAELIASLGLVDEGSDRLVPLCGIGGGEIDEVRGVGDDGLGEVNALAVAEGLAVAVVTLGVGREETEAIFVEWLARPLPLVFYRVSAPARAWSNYRTRKDAKGATTDAEGVGYSLMSATRSRDMSADQLAAVVEARREDLVGKGEDALALARLLGGFLVGVVALFDLGLGLARLLSRLVAVARDVLGLDGLAFRLARLLGGRVLLRLDRLPLALLWRCNGLVVERGERRADRTAGARGRGRSDRSSGAGSHAGWRSRHL